MWSVLLDGIIHRNPLLFLLWNFWILHCNRYHGLRSVTSYSDPYNVCWWEFFRLAFVSSVGSLINEFRSIFLPYLTPVSCCAIEKLRLHTLCYTSGKLAAILQNPLEYRPCSFHRTVPPVHILISVIISFKIMSVRIYYSYLWFNKMEFLQQKEHIRILCKLDMNYIRFKLSYIFKSIMRFL